MKKANKLRVLESFDSFAVNEDKVPQGSKKELAAEVKKKLDRIRAMDDKELMRFITDNFTPAALKRYMK